MSAAYRRIPPVTHRELVPLLVKATFLGGEVKTGYGRRGHKAAEFLNWFPSRCIEIHEHNLV